jgi:hypothetical protein
MLLTQELRRLKLARLVLQKTRPAPAAREPIAKSASECFEEHETNE